MPLTIKKGRGKKPHKNAPTLASEEPQDPLADALGALARAKGIKEDEEAPDVGVIDVTLDVKQPDEEPTSVVGKAVKALWGSKQRTGAK